MIQVNSRALILGFLFILTFASAVDAQKDGVGDSIVKAFFNDNDSNKITKNDYAQSSENAFQLLNGAQAEAVLNWIVLEAQRKSIANRKIVRVLRKELKQHSNSGFRNLQLYNNMLEDIQAENIRISEIFDEEENKLEEAKRKIKTITQDSIIRHMIQQSVLDTTKRRNRTKKLKAEYTYTSELIKTSLDSIQRWSSAASFQSIMISELLQKTDSIMQQSSLQAWKGDCVDLWDAKVKVGVVDTTGNDIAGGTDGNQKIVKYYVGKNLSSILWIPFFIFLIFLRWIWKNYKRVTTSSNTDLRNDEKIQFIKRSRILLSIIVSLSLFPLLDVHAPWFYLLLSQCVIIGCVTFFFWQGKSRAVIPIWLVFFGLLVGISVANSFEPDLLQRITLVLINVISIVAAIFLLPKIKYMPQLPRTIRVITFVYILLNALALLANLFGRVIIAEALTNTAIIALTQIITLSVLVEAIIEALYLQLLASRIKRGISTDFEYQETLKSIHKPLFVFVLLVWLIMFTANLYMYEMFKDGITKLLTMSLSLGSLSFSIGNMLLFFIIIWMAHLLQQYIGTFFGDGESDDDLESKKQRSRMMVVKLVVICFGYLLAVAVSGLPLDKITIILGALGVGVGMGLQSIVNNFVSGVVLIFDRPLQIGDSIEVGANKGKVKTIGIRASTLLTPDGAEVIIPNGDILSSPITNWTLSNNQRRVELEFKLKTEESKDAVIELIKTSLESYDEIVADREPTFLLEDVKDNEIKLKVYFWCNNISKADHIRSEVRYLLYGEFHKRGIVVI
jgi:potassium efflux system protein